MVRAAATLYIRPGAWRSVPAAEGSVHMGSTEFFPAGFSLQDQLRQYERDLIVNALEAVGGHQRRAAAALGIRPTTLNEKMKRLGLRRDSQAADLFAPRSRFGR